MAWVARTGFKKPVKKVLKRGTLRKGWSSSDSAGLRKAGCSWGQHSSSPREWRLHWEPLAPRRPRQPRSKPTPCHGWPCLGRASSPGGNTGEHLR